MSPPHWKCLGRSLSVLLLVASPAASAPTLADTVTARGRLEPRNGVRRVAGPAELVSVVDKLQVEEGDKVRAGQLLAVMDTFEVRDAHARRLRSELASGEAAIVRQDAEAANAREEQARASQLLRDGVGAASESERWAKRVAAAEAALAQARAEHATVRAALRAAETERDRALVRAPITGQVIKVHARPGERVGAEGILELGETSAMYAVAEVYETDAPRLKRGQRAEVRSPALARPLAGVVERVGLKVGRLSAVGADPAARNDARAVEVKVRLDDSSAAASLTDLEVEITIRLR